MRNRFSELLPSPFDIDPIDIVLEPSLDGAAQWLLHRIGFAEKQALLVCDANTYSAWGARLMRELAAPRLLMLEGRPHADEGSVDFIRTHDYDVLIAVGSGTISDLCKYASFRDDKPYAVFPTAASMNGYLSKNASITVNGHKQSLPAHLPKGVFCDLGILAAAPKRLTLAGLGDSLCRPTAQADWLLSHLLLDTPYTPAPFDLLTPYEDELFAHAALLAAGDHAVLELLVKTLLVSGLGMVIAGGSYPASQGEHLIAHTMEMKYGDKLPERYHGEQIGVTTLTMAKIQQHAIAHKLHLVKRRRREAAITSYFGTKLAASVAEASFSKHLLYERYDEINARLEKKGSFIREALGRVMLPEAQLHAVLDKAGAPASIAALGWNERDYELAVIHARHIRDRFTFLDMI